MHTGWGEGVRRSDVRHEESRYLDRALVEGHRTDPLRARGVQRRRRRSHLPRRNASRPPAAAAPLAVKVGRVEERHGEAAREKGPFAGVAPDLPRRRLGHRGGVVGQ